MYFIIDVILIHFPFEMVGGQEINRHIFFLQYRKYWENIYVFVFAKCFSRTVQCMNISFVAQLKSLHFVWVLKLLLPIIKYSVWEMYLRQKQCFVTTSFARNFGKHYLKMFSWHTWLCILGFVEKGFICSPCLF